MSRQLGGIFDLKAHGTLVILTYNNYDFQIERYYDILTIFSYVFISANQGKLFKKCN